MIGSAAAVDDVGHDAASMQLRVSLHPSKAAVDSPHRAFLSTFIFTMTADQPTIIGELVVVALKAVLYLTRCVNATWTNLACL